MRFDGDLPAPDVALPPDVVRALAHSGDWISAWSTVVGAGLVAVAVVGLAVRARRHRTRSWPWWSTGVVAVVVAVAVGVNAVVGYVPTVAAARITLAGWGVLPPPRAGHTSADHGAVAAYRVPADPALRLPSSYTWVYTPPGYDPAAQTRYPVVVLLHGAPGASGDWFAAGDAAHTLDVLIGAGLVPPLIAVAPDLNAVDTQDSECLDSTTGGSQLETYLTSTLPDWVDATFRTVPDAAHRVLAGFSAGGFCALDQGLRHPDKFGTIVALDAYPDPGSAGRHQLATDAERQAHDVASYASTVPLSDQHIYLAVAGGSAHESTAVRTIADVLHRRGADVVLTDLSGHTWVTARRALPKALVWAATRLPG